MLEHTRVTGRILLKLVLNKVLYVCWMKLIVECKKRQVDMDRVMNILVP
jgi:hypothetical protein